MPAVSSNSTSIITLQLSKRTLAIVAVGSISLAATIAWLFNRRKINKKSIGASVVESDTTTMKTTSTTIVGESSSAARAGRRNYRQEQSSSNPNKNDDESTIIQSASAIWASDEMLAAAAVDKLCGNAGDNHQHQHLMASSVVNINDHKGYQTVESPSVASQHSELSDDSGRATNDMESSMSPVEELCDVELTPMYEFEIPNTLVGLIIGIKGKTIQELCQRANVQMIIRQHHMSTKATTHQICTIEGKYDNIIQCLQMLRRRFPPTRFPELSLNPVLPQTTEMFANQTALSDGVCCEVVLSSTDDTGHLFLQQPSFTSPQRIDYYMLGIYNQTSPELSNPCDSDEVSADSGRATGGMASSMSPVEELCDVELTPMYEFEIPNTLVGLIIGIKGKTIKELCLRADVKMIIRQHHTSTKVTTHQICTVEGKRDSINRCLQMLRRRFPPSRFPELNLKPVLPPPIPSPATEMFGSQATPLTLPDSVRCEVVLSSMVDTGHFFLQQPTHPSFSSLQRLDYYMLGIYSQTDGIPELPKPCETNLLCVAPALGGWYRAVTVVYYDEHDEVLVRFVDYGGYSRIPRADLRQIRTDFMTLPFQATECYLAHVIPADGNQWTDEANEVFQSYAMSKVIEANIVAYHPEDRTPMVELHTTDANNQAVQIHRVLVDSGYAKFADDTYIRRPITCSTNGTTVS